MSDDIKPSDPRENYRRDDPHTSRERAETLDTLGNKEAILASLKFSGPCGMTTGELAVSLQKERAKFSSQVTQLRRDGLVFYAGRDRDKQQVWVHRDHYVAWANGATDEERKARDEQQEKDLAPSNNTLREQLETLKAELADTKEAWKICDGARFELAQEVERLRKVEQEYIKLCDAIYSLSPVEDKPNGET